MGIERKRIIATLLALCLIGAVFVVTRSCPAYGAVKDLTGATFTVKAKKSGANTKVTWTKAEGASYYKVYRSTSKAGKKTLLAKKVTSLKYTDKKGISGKNYYYHVRAYNSKTRSDYQTSDKFRTVFRVYVETGHGTGTDGRWDSGCLWTNSSGKKFQEAKLMIPIAKATCDYLKKNGVYVYTDAYDDNNRNLKYTLSFLDSHSVSAFLNIHCDAAFEDAGTLPLYRTAEQKEFATALNKAVHEYVEIADRGLEKRKDLDTLNSSKVHCPACLYETGNIKKDNKTLTGKTDAYGKGLAKGVCDFLGLEFTEK